MLLIRIVFYHVSRNLSLYCLFYVTMNICFHFYLNIERDAVVLNVMSWFCLYLLELSPSLHIYTQACIWAHKHICMISTQEEWQEPGTEA